ncbi:PilW family protein [Wenzhouxiangella limi]|uniref:Prepilin-type N-terminal cleavage/methylation domain-containing protein n=1 Tax=Wenzhouxiangella limi TaxID=2707351 RepID=A0A845UUP6_9GAMM|nr:prepilin-type N-terminal cleavage/methylation domain-containing protein [Wenzhouxiangella limi]NDY94274.1 prepilin-type N-terminal cleavage/methylation domain-containing protein [Wenzhouxiangella limi]
MSSRFPRPANRNQGFSLVELMVAMALSLIVISAIIGVFAANQQTSRAQADLNNAQEAFRFASHTIKRVVRQGDEIETPASGEWLKVVIRPEGENGYKDCLGREITIETTNTFSIVDGNLRCSAANADGTLTETIVGGLDASNSVVLFGQASDQYWADNDQWKVPASVTDWDDVRSVNVSLAMLDRSGQSHGRVGRFSATMRMPVLEEASGIGGAGGSPGGGSGTNGSEGAGNDSNDENDGSDANDQTDDTGGTDDDGNDDGTNEDDGDGDGGTDGNNDDDGDSASGSPDPGTCQCLFKNKGSTLISDPSNAESCSNNCCDANEPGGNIKNNTSFSISAGVCQ